MRALVTGASGFCGRHLVRLLERDAVEVHTVSRSVARATRHHTADPLDVHALTAAFRAARPDYVLHLAGVSQASDVAGYYRVNTLYAANLIDAALAAGLADRPMLVVGTAAEYGSVEAHELPITEETCPRPVSHYGASKLAQTHLARVAARGGRPVTVARAANIVGPGMPEHLAVQSFLRQAAEVASGRRDPVVEVGNVDGVRDFVDVEDAVALYWRLLREPRAQGEVVNVCTGAGTRVGDLLARVIRIAGVAVDVRQDPARAKPTDVPVHVGSRAKLERLLGPVAFTELDVTLTRAYTALLSQL